MSIDTPTELHNMHRHYFDVYLSALQHPEKAREMDLERGEAFYQLLEHASALERFEGKEYLNNVVTAFSESEREALLQEALNEVQDMDIAEQLEVLVEDFLAFIESEEQDPADFIEIIDNVTGLLVEREAMQDVADGMRGLGLENTLVSLEPVSSRFRSFLHYQYAVDAIFLCCPPLTLEATVPFRNLAISMQGDLNTDRAWWYLSEEVLAERCENFMAEQMLEQLALLETRQDQVDGGNVLLKLADPATVTAKNVLNFPQRDKETAAPSREALLAAEAPHGGDVSSVHCRLEALPDITVLVRRISDTQFQFRVYDKQNPATERTPPALKGAKVQVLCDGIVLAEGAFDAGGIAEITLPEPNALYYLTEVLLADPQDKRLSALQPLF